MSLPVKIEANSGGDYDHANGYGEPPAKRHNSGPSVPAVSTTASRNQCE